MSRGHHTRTEIFKTRPTWKVKKNSETTWKKHVFVTALRCKLKNWFFDHWVFFGFSKSAEWHSKIDSYSQDEMSRKHFSSDEKLLKNVKKTDFQFFFIIGPVFFKGIHRKNKNANIFSHRFLFLIMYFQKQKCKIF